MERPITQKGIITVGVVFLLMLGGFGYRAFSLQVVDGESYAHISLNNTLRRSVLFANRGLVYDRRGNELAWNEADVGESIASSSITTFPLRYYTDRPGFAHILGFIRYPKADQSGNWWREEYTGVSGIEHSFDERLAGINGSVMIERDAIGKIERENIVVPPQKGEDLHLSIDADVQSQLYAILSKHAEGNRFRGGAAVIMDVRTGELLALTSFPEYDNQAFTDGVLSVIAANSNDVHTPLLNRAVTGLYTPGSIVKPLFAAAALNEGIISPEKQIESTGAIKIPNPYDPDKPSIYRDWTVHGWVDMREAIAVSSDEYFYVIGGGYQGQAGLGIRKIDEYAHMFGFDTPTGIALTGEASGIIPTPEWKEEVFPGDPWRLGNTYHTVIGQYGFQITPLEAVRYTAALANGGKLLTPQLLASSTPVFTEVGIPDSHLSVAREGMRLTVTSNRSDATVRSLNIPGMQIAGKTGTAQLGAHNEYMNSWVIGFWPADNPKYAFAVVLEHAPAGTLSGAAPGMNPFFYWLLKEHPEYIN